MPRPIAIAVVAGTLLLAGCNSISTWWHNGCRVGPNYEPPCAAVATTWLDADSVQLLQSSPDCTLNEWWYTFDDPDLNTLIAQAQDANLDLLKAQWRIAQARSDRHIVAGAFVPQSRVGIGYAHGQIGNNLTQGALPTVFNIWGDGIGLAWELDLWGRIRRQVESADASVDASALAFEETRLLLLADVATNYIQMRTFEKRIEFATRNIAIQQETLTIARARLENDSASELDSQQSQAVLSQTEAIVCQLKVGLRHSQNRIAMLLGRSPGEAFPMREAVDIPSVASVITVGIPADLLRRRPDIRRAERQVASQAALIGVAESDLYPRFSLAGMVGDVGNNFGDLLRASSFTGLVLPVVQWKILNFHQVLSSIAVQQAKFEQEVLDYQQKVLKANYEVEDSLVAYLQAVEQKRHLTVGAAAAERSVDLIMSQYREGTATFNRVLEAQQQLVKIQDQLAIIQQDASVALIRIYKALGGGWGCGV